MHIIILWCDIGVGAITPWAVLPQKMQSFFEHEKSQYVLKKIANFLP